MTYALAPGAWVKLPRMVRSELITRLAERFPQLAAKDAELSVQLILQALNQALVNKVRIEIRGFGSFSVNYRPPRKGRNPLSGQLVSVPAKYVPHFRPGKELRSRVGASVEDDDSE